MRADAQLAIRLAESLFNSRRIHEGQWDTAYRYILPGRAVFYNSERNRDSPQDVANEVFDSTAVDSAERLANLILAKLTPPWAEWFRVVPGNSVLEPTIREAMRGPLQLVTQRMHAALYEGNFYQEFQPVILDRIVGGTGSLVAEPESKEVPLRFRNSPLSETAMSEDAKGRIDTIAQKQYYTLRELETSYPGKVPAQIKEAQGSKPFKDDQRDLCVFHLERREVDGTYAGYSVLKNGPAMLHEYTSAFPLRYATRWTKLPGVVYGRGPGLRAIADVRALNKLVELSLKQAMLAAASPYTVLDDGVINVHTTTLEPGELIPVSSNDQQNPTIRPLEQSRSFDVSMFNIESLRNNIKSIFMMDRFGDINRTPLSATEVSERTRIIAEDMGMSIGRLQQEMLAPMLKSLFEHMGQLGQVPAGIPLDGKALRVEFVSYLAQSQWDAEGQAIVEWAEMASLFGQVDPEAGMVVDLPAVVRKRAELKGIPAELIRTQPEVEQLKQKATEGIAAANQAQQQMGLAET